MTRSFLISLLFILLLLTACNKDKRTDAKKNENVEAKNMLQGVWCDLETEDVVFKAKGDTIYYPDSLSRPVYFKIIGDTIYMGSDDVSQYYIVKQTANIFKFSNSAGEFIELRRLSENETDSSIFVPTKVVNVNQNKKIKKDTVVISGNSRYHCYTQVNPSSFKIYSKSYNSNGVAVDHVYYDNIVYVGIFEGSQKRFSANFHKKDFAKYLPKQYQQNGILSEINLDHVDTNVFHYVASICLPDESVSFVIGIDIDKKGNIQYKNI